MSTVHTPRGHAVELIDDATAIGLMEGGEHAFRQWKNRAPVIQALWDAGPFENPSGFATGLLYEAACERGYSSASTGMASQLQRTLVPFIDRQVQGRRCYRIALTAIPESWYRKVHRNGYRHAQAELPVEELATPLEPEVPAEPDAPEEPDEDAASGHLAEHVAAALLARVVEVIATPDRNEQAVRDLQRRLGEQVSYVEKLRRDAADARDLVAALTVERDGLRRELRDVRGNLDRIMRDDGRVYIDAQLRRELDRLMREVPSLRAAS